MSQKISSTVPNTEEAEEVCTYVAKEVTVLSHVSSRDEKLDGRSSKLRKEQPIYLHSRGWRCPFHLPKGPQTLFDTMVGIQSAWKGWPKEEWKPFTIMSEEADILVRRWRMPQDRRVALAVKGTIGSWHFLIRTLV